MRAKLYAVGLVSVALTMFAATVVANIVMDPQGVLGTGLMGGGQNGNSRYQTFEVFLNASRAPEGLLFGSSRAHVISTDRLAREFGVAGVARFSVSGGQIADHLKVLEYAMNDPRGKPRAVFMQLDADFFGDRQIGFGSMNNLDHPALTGEGRFRFAWRHFVAIQPEAWADQWRAFRYGIHKAHAPSLGPRRYAMLPSMSILNDATALPVLSIQATPSSLPAARSNATHISERPDFGHQLALYRKFVNLCAEHGVRLVVTLSPLRDIVAAQLDTADLAALAGRLAQDHAVWDFGVPAWLSAQPQLWQDNSHFTPAVADMMLDRIFAGREARKDFGQFVEGR